MAQEQERKTVRMSEITPEILENINVGDWIEGIGDVGCYYDRKIIRIVGTWLRRFTPPNKDDVHWITGAELREIYTGDLSLDKYDEIRKRAPAHEAMLAESLTEDQTRTLLMWLARNKKEMFSQIVCPNCREDVAEKAAAEARKDERERILPLVKEAQKIQFALFRACWDKNTIELVKQVGLDLRKIEETLGNPATPAAKGQKP